MLPEDDLSRLGEEFCAREPNVTQLVLRQAGQFTPGVMYFGIRDGVVDLVINPRFDERVSTQLRSRLAAARDSIIAGTLAVPRIEFVADSVPVAR